MKDKEKIVLLQSLTNHASKCDHSQAKGPKNAAKIVALQKITECLNNALERHGDLEPGNSEPILKVMNDGLCTCGYHNGKLRRKNRNPYWQTLLYSEKELLAHSKLEKVFQQNNREDPLDSAVMITALVTDQRFLFQIAEVVCSMMTYVLSQMEGTLKI